MVVIGAPEADVLAVIREDDIGFVDHILVAFLHRSAGLRIIFLLLFFRQVGLVLRRGGRELFAVVFLLRLRLCDLHVGIGLRGLLRLDLLFAGL